MSFYRTLKVENKIYEYHIGRDFVKIKNFKKNGFKGNVFPIEIITNKTNCIVTPGMIKNYILDIENKPEDFFHDCGCEGIEKRVTSLPFDREIYEKSHYVYWCQDCLDKNSYDI